ncbi:MAG TPA: M48 family metalloprotease [Croceibacterium sp.]|nr:M48 family metalloprotease [Croceibacterium sp.]
MASTLAGPGAMSPARAQNNLPALGDSVSEDLPVGVERKIGDQIMREIRRDPDYSDDPLLLEYLESVWQPLVAQARLRGEIGADTDERFAWEAFLVRDRSVNAFALPGGYVGVHLGLIALTSTRDELASVLAHEMSHVTQRHIARSIGNSKRQSLIGLATLIVGVLAASRAGNSSADAANAAIVGGLALAAQGQLNFSRDMEREADRVGMGVMHGAGFAPGGMAAMFEKLDQTSRLNDTGGFPYLRSHPLTSERIGEARSRLGPGALVPAAKPNPIEHAIAQSRARVLMDPRVDALRRAQSRDAERGSGATPEQVAAAYESALASTLLRDWGRADASLQAAAHALRGDNGAAKEPRAERALVLLAAQSQLDRGAPARSAALLAPYAAERSRPLLLLSTQTALAQSDEAALKRRSEDLQTWLAARPSDALAWSVLSQAFAKLGQPLRAIRADAEASLALGDLQGAADRLRAGQRRARGGPGGASADFIDASVIDARLRDIETLRRQLAADARAAR